MANRKQTEKRLTNTLTKMVENSRESLTYELSLLLTENQEVVETTLELINEDCDKKLLMIPSVIKGMLDQADENAQKIALGS